MAALSDELVQVRTKKKEFLAIDLMDRLVAGIVSPYSAVIFTRRIQQQIVSVGNHAATISVAESV